MNKSYLNQTAVTVKLPTSPYSCLETKDDSLPKRSAVSASKISDKWGKMLHSKK
jgi:hypothetical protein